MNTFWVLTAKSESFDDYGPFVFGTKPSQLEIAEFLKNLTPDEFVDECECGLGVVDCECGPGSFGSYLHISLEKCVIEKLSNTSQ